MMNIEEKKENGVLVVRVLNDRLDANVALEFKDKMVSYINGGEQSIVLNVAAVDFVDSSGLGAIVSSLKKMDKNGDIVISCAKQTVKRLFRLTRMNKVFRMYETEQDAMEAFYDE
jgi:anti-sigma B factor antagonist